MNDEIKSCSTPSNAEPTASRSTLPMWILALTFVLLFLGFVFFDFHGGWFNAQVYRPYVSAEELELYQPKSGEAALLAQGKRTYDMVCGTCHSVDGLGKPGQAPPLAGSEWVTTKGVQRLIHIPLVGVTGPMQVKGQEWNLSMAAMGAGLSDADLASVLTYIRGSWGNKAEAVSADDVKAVRAAVGGHSQPLTAEQLKALAE